jgi:HK97 family phage portal protein
MSLLDRLFGARQSRFETWLASQPAEPVRNEATSWAPFDGYYSVPASGYAVTDDSAMRVAAAYACARLIAGAIASLPLPVYRRTDIGRKRAEHPLYWLLNERPEPRFSAAVMWEFVLQSLMFRGDGLVEILRPSSRSSGVVGFRPHPPAKVRIEVAGDELLYIVTEDGRARAVNAADMLHIPGFGFNGRRGLSVIRHAAEQAIGNALAMDEYSGRFFANGANPSIVLKHAGKMPPEQVEDLRTKWSSLYAGAANSGRPMILTGGLDFQQVSISAEDAQLLDARKFQVTDIARAFGVPPFMIGDTEKTSSWGSGIEHMSIGFVTYTLQPYLTKIEQELNAKLFPRLDRYFVEFNVEGLLRGDSKSRAEFYQAALGGSAGPGWMTRNEVRRLENLPPKDGGDEPTPWPPQKRGRRRLRRSPCAPTDSSNSRRTTQAARGSGAPWRLPATRPPSISTTSSTRTGASARTSS